MHIIAIAAMAENRVIGNHGNIPWNIPEEQQFFKKETLGSTVIMGRSTFDSIGRCLPWRRNIVLSRWKMDFSPSLEKKPEVFHSIEHILTSVAWEDRCYICWGWQVYTAFFDRGIVDEVILSVIPGEYEGDVIFPAFENNFVLFSEEQHDLFRILRYRRR